MYGFIINKEAGNGKGNRVWNRVEKSMKQQNYDYVVRYTEGPNHATVIVADYLRSGVKTIIIVGGDGTIHEVSNGLAYQDIPIGIIPAGSGNDFARCIGVPKNCLKALDRILRNNPRTIDLLDLDGDQCCLTVTGIGFDGQVAQDVNQSSYKKYLNYVRLGGLSYVVSMLKTLRGFKPTNMEITIDGKDMFFPNVWLVAVANGPNYGGGIKICPDAKYDDGFFNVCIVHNIKGWELLRLFPKAFFGKHTNEKNVISLKGAEISVRSEVPVIVQSDGEYMKESPIHIGIQKAALRVL